MSDLQIEAPDHWHREAQDHEINQEIGYAIPTVELILIDACPTLDGFIPIKADGSTFKNGDEERNDVVKEYDRPSCCEKPTKPAHYAKDTVVKKDE